MISPAIISKFNLKETTITIGESFRNGCTVYLFPNLVHGAKSYFMDCDLEGNSLSEGLLLIAICEQCRVHRVFLTSEFIEMQDFKTLQALLDPFLIRS